MHLIRWIREVSPGAWRSLLGMAALSGAANALLLAIINRAAEAATTQTRSDRYFFLFVILIGIYVIAQRYLLTRSAEVIETSLDAVRCGLTERLRKADLHPLERINRSTIYSSISKQVVTISQAAPTIIIACQSALMILFSAIYLASLSTAGFLITVLMMVIGVSIHFEKSKELQRDMQSIVIQENGYFDLLTQMLDGFKEVKLNSRRCTAIVERLRATSEAVARLKISYSTRFSSHFLFSQTFFYILVGSIVFLLPRFSPPYSSVVIKMTTAILFIIGPLGGLIGSIPVMTAANVAVKNILDLDELLQTAGSPGEDKLPVHSPPPFHQIHLAGLSFQYEGVSDTAGFGVGPLDLEIRAGEILFLVGGNGSGKSTLLKLITGLYHPAAGEIRLDGAAVRPEDYAAYRSLFSAIFSDYHLFDRLYGIEVKDPGLVQKLLEDFGLDTKTSLDDERWSTVELSSGQRKRLALIVNTLEDRPIQVFDEWAADQDPLFRKRFYEELLPRMRKQGKTIIAATHDDRYFHVADHVLKLEYGQIVAAAGKETV